MSRAVVAVPLAIERWFLGRVPGADVVHVGGRARRAAIPAGAAGVAVVGVAGALVAGMRPGDVVVAAEVRDGEGSVPCPAAPLVAGALRACGLTVHIGPVHTADHLVDGPERAELAATGAIAVDTESAPLVRAAGGNPRIVLRAVADTPDRPLRSLATVPGGVRALRALRRAAPVLAEWAAALGERDVVLASPRAFRGGVAAATDLVVVLGSANSSTSRRLVEVAERAGTRAVLVDDPAGLTLDLPARIGVTAGASAPPAPVDDLVAALAGLGPVRSTETTTAVEDVRFSLPKEVG